MMTGSIGRRLLRLAGVLALAGFTVGCAGAPDPTLSAPPGYGKDPASRAERLVSYCDRLAKKGEMVTALGLCARAHEIDPDNPETLMKIAGLLTTMGRQEAAVQTYNALLERHPRHHEARYSLGKLHMERGDAAMAAVQFDQAIAADPKDPRPYNALGILRDQAGEHGAAQALYRKALEQDPANTSARNNLGLSLALNGKRDEAIAVLAELAVDAEGDPEAELTVLRNLEAAYTARAATGPATATPVPPAAPAADPLKPVASEPLDAPAPATPAAVKTSEEAPALEGAPTPLFMPPGATAGEPQQSGARPPAPARTPTPLAAAAGPQNSVILAAAAELMQPPEWADFEPGALLGAEPPPQSGALNGPDPEAADPAAPEAPQAPQAEVGPGAYDLSMLMVASAASLA